MTKPKQINWPVFLKRAIKKAPSEAERSRAVKAASSWPTCACGKLCKRLPKNKRGAPKDNQLMSLGLRFQVEILRTLWPEALNTWHAIEARTAVLLAEQKARGK